MKKILLAVISLTFLNSTLLAQEKTENIQIVALGDSLTAGYGIGQDLAWPALLEESLNKNNSNKVSVLNAGVSGDTSAGGLRRLGWVLQNKTDILIIALGANDMMRGQPAENTKENLIQIIDKAKSKHPKIKILLCGIKALPSMGDSYVKGFEKIFEEIRDSEKVTMMPFILEGVAGNKKLNLKDRIHPNEKGHKVIAEAITPYVKEMLRK